MDLGLHKSLKGCAVEVPHRKVPGIVRVFSGHFYPAGKRLEGEVHCLVCLCNCAAELVFGIGVGVFYAGAAQNIVELVKEHGFPGIA